MTEAQWVAATDPLPMLTFLRGRGTTERKIRLFLCGCSRQVWDRWNYPDSRTAVTTAERFEDGIATLGELLQAHATAASLTDAILSLATGNTRHWAIRQSDAINLYPGCRLATLASEQPVRDLTAEVNRPWFKGAVAHRQGTEVLHDIIGNPFRPVTFDPLWRTPTVATLATRMYESRDFSAMPILADALEDAGCEDAEVLGHCRGDGPHVRGCWVVDSVMSKSCVAEGMVPTNPFPEKKP